MPRYLVVANQTLGSTELVAKMDELSKGPGSFRLLVPVTDTEGTRQWDYPAVDRFVPDAHVIARSLAEGRLQHELERLHEAKVDASGEVVDAEPIDHVRQALHAERYDGVVVATLPHRLSRWTVMDLPHRIARASDVPVTHLLASAGPSL
jgi:nucleotide-binding universal stress UspA family protein